MRSRPRSPLHFNRPRGRTSGGWPLLLAILAVSAAATPASAASDVEYAVIASPDVLVSDLSIDALRRFFQFTRKYWKPGNPVTILLSDSGMEPGSFLLSQVYQLHDRASLRRLILEKLYQGQIDLAPKIVASDELAIQFVAAGRGLLAVVRADRVGDAGVKVLALDGKLPGSRGYPGRRSNGDRETP